jgi:hypothetical protein
MGVTLLPGNGNTQRAATRLRINVPVIAAGTNPKYSGTEFILNRCPRMAPCKEAAIVNVTKNLRNSDRVSFCLYSPPLLSRRRMKKVIGDAAARAAG